MTTAPDELRRLIAGLADPGLAGPLLASHRATGGRAAAVLILLSPSPQGLQITFVEKSATLRSHAGQIAFPGGSLEPGDPSALAAALREADEEVGIPPAEVQVLGALPPAHVRATGYDVTGVVGYWPTPVPLRPVDTREIAAVHVIDVATLVDPAHRLTWTISMGFHGPAFVVDDLFIWGFSAMLLDGLLELAGWSQPWETGRTAEVPVRFSRERPR